MEEATQAFVFFWLAGLFVLSGGMLGLFSKVAVQRKVGLAMASAGLLSLMATPWTLSFSPSSAFGHLLGSLVGPSVLLGVGFYLITFSGNVPVGQLSRADRRTGVVMVLTGVLWLEAMHWWELTPTYPGEVNRYWLIFWPTMLLGLLAFGAGAAALVGCCWGCPLTAPMWTTTNSLLRWSSQRRISSASWSAPPSPSWCLRWCWAFTNHSSPLPIDWHHRRPNNWRRRARSSPAT